MQQRQLYDSHIDAFYKALRQRRFDRIEDVIAQLRTSHRAELRYPLWAEYFAGILAEERDRDWAAADACYRRVLAAEADGILRAHVLLSRGVAYDKQARWQDAVAACEESAATWAALGYPVRRAMVLRQVAISCKNGYLAGDLGPDALARAADLCRHALATFEQQLARPPEVIFYEPDLALYIAFTWSELGNVELAAGNLAQAGDYYQRFLAFCHARNDRYHKAHAYWDLGNVLQLRGQNDDWERAEANYLEALLLFRDVAEAYYEFNVLASLGSLSALRGDLAGATTRYSHALEIIETLRAGVSSAEMRGGFAATVANIYAQAVLTHLAAGDVAAAFDCAEQARARAFLDSLVSGTVDFSDRYRPMVNTRACTLAQLTAALPPDVLVLAYFTTGLLKHHGGRLTAREARNSVLFPEAKTLLFTVTHAGVTVIDLELSPNTLVPGDANQLVETTFLPAQVRRALYARLLSPVQEQLAGTRRLYVIPHGPLHYVPFQALIAPDGDTLLSDNGPEIVYAPSATILLHTPTRRAPPPHATCLAVGYNGDGGRELRFAEDEAGYIARMTAGHALVGPAPKKAALFARAPEFQSLHFSCHGTFDPTSPLDSGLLIGAGETLSGQEIMDNLRLNCELVTLSACESGLSTVQRGDELYGLLRAFMYAGAPAVIATLWRVDERSTLIFAAHFYQAVQAGADYGRALKTAQLALKSLTRKEARRILARDGTGGEQQEHATTIVTRTETDPASRQPPTAPSLDLLPGNDDDAPFAAPVHWAPFVLIGDAQLQLRD